MLKSHHIAKKGRNRTKVPENSPQNGGSCFHEKCFCVLGTGAKMRMSLFEGFLFSGKMVLRFRDWCKNAHVPFWAILVLKKNIVEVDNVFAIYFQEIRSSSSDPDPDPDPDPLWSSSLESSNASHDL